MDLTIEQKKNIVSAAVTDSLSGKQKATVFSTEDENELYRLCLVTLLVYIKTKKSVEIEFPHLDPITTPISPAPKP